MRVLGLVVARGGSKGLPGKNLRPLAGRPLIAWTIEAARRCPDINRLILSTDAMEIAEEARRAGCEVPFMRPPHLAKDDTPAIEVALHALDSVSGVWDVLVLLQPTSPLRLPEDISACLHACRNGAPGCIGVVRATESPYWMFTFGDAGRLEPVVPRERIPLRRQDQPATFLINGAVYVARCDWLRLHRSFVGPGVQGYEMPPERSIDIDNIAGFESAQSQLAKIPGS